MPKRTRPWTQREIIDQVAGRVLAMNDAQLSTLAQCISERAKRNSEADRASFTLLMQLMLHLGEPQ